MSSLIVAKFGGSSLADGRGFKTVGRRIARNADIRAIVVSAPGKVNGEDTKVTDMLMRIARAASSSQPLDEGIRGIGQRFERIENEAGLDMGERISPLVHDMVLERVKIASGNDAPIAALGEELNARLVVNYLKKLGLKFRYLDPREAGFTVKSEGGRVFVDEEQHIRIREAVQHILDNGERVVLPGFFGFDPDGSIQTFERGGSDYSGAVLASALHAGLYQNFTDTDGIRVAEPSIDPNAPLIRTMTHRELNELTLGGRFGVFQYEAAVPLSIHRITTQVLCTFDDCSRGTYILPQVGSSDSPITGIVHRGEFVAFEVVKYGVANAVGFFGDMLALFGQMGVSVEHAPSSINNISVIVKKRNLERQGLRNADIIETVRSKLDVHDLKIHELSTVAVVGEELCRTPGIGQQIFDAVYKAGVNVHSHINQGVSFILWLKNGDGKKAADAIYRRYFGLGDVEN